MNIQLFFQFPGVLILIGVILLIIAIVIGILAYRKVDDDSKTFDANEISNDTDSFNLSVNDQVSEVKEELIVEEDSPIVTVEQNNEVKVEEAVIEEPVIKEEVPIELEEKEEEFIIEDTVIKEDKEKLDDQTFNEMIKKFDEAIETEEFIELNNIEVNEEVKDISNDENIEEVKEDKENEIEPLLKDFILSDEELNEETFNDELLNLDNTLVQPSFIEALESAENIKEHQPIYGGVNPLDNVKLDFDNNVERPLYGDKNFTPSEPIIVDYEDKKVIEEEEEIEML